CATCAENRWGRRDAVEPPAGRSHEELTAEHRSDSSRWVRRQHDPAARGRERRRLRADVRDEADGLGRLLESDEERLETVEDRERDGLVVPREELRGNGAVG